MSRADPVAAAQPGGVVRVALRHFDRLFDGVVGVFGVLFSLQTADSFVADLPSFAGPPGTAVLALLAAGVLTGLGALVLPARSRAVFGVAVALYVAALLLWPIAMRPPVPTDPMPLLVALWPVPAAHLTQALRSRVAPIAIAAVCSTIAVLALWLRGESDLPDALINGFFMLALAVVMVLLLGTVRRGIRSVAGKQQEALDAFAAATIEDVTEEERRRTDALLHDAVLTTFLSAAAASTPGEEDLAARMAGNSLRVLMHVNGIGRDESAVPFGRAVASDRDRLAPLLAAFEVDLARAEPVMLPRTVARALVDVLLEAMAESAGGGSGVRRAVRGDRLGPDGIHLLVEDARPGADPVDVEERWSVDGSPAVAALRGVEGRVDARATGTGTTVQLRWGSVVIVGTTPLAAEPTGAQQ